MTSVAIIRIGLIAVLLAPSCSRPTPGFFILSGMTEEIRTIDEPINDTTCVRQEAPGESVRIASKLEIVTISNAPEKLSDLAEAIARYNRQTLTNEVLSRWCVYHRAFYRETWQVRRELRESSSADTRELDRYWKELLAQTSWRTGGFSTEHAQYYVDGSPVRMSE